jgi:hypothetical protein
VPTFNWGQVIGDVAEYDKLSKFEHCMSGGAAGRVVCTWILLPRLALRDAVSRREREAIYAGTSPGNLSGSAERMVPGERTHNDAMDYLSDRSTMEN